MEMISNSIDCQHIITHNYQYVEKLRPSNWVGISEEVSVVSACFEKAGSSSGPRWKSMAFGTTEKNTTRRDSFVHHHVFFLKRKFFVAIWQMTVRACLLYDHTFNRTLKENQSWRRERMRLWFNVLQWFTCTRARKFISIVMWVLSFGTFVSLSCVYTIFAQ